MATVTGQGAITTIATGSITDAILSPDGQSLYVARAGIIYDYSMASGDLLKQWQLGTKLDGIDVSPDSRYLVATEALPGSTTGSGFNTTTTYSVYRLDLSTGTKQTFTNAVINYNGSDYHDVAYLSNGTAILTQNYPGSGFTPLTTLNFTTGEFAAGQTYAQNGTLTATRDHTKVVFTPSNISDEPIAVYRVDAGIVAYHGGYADNISGFNNGVQAISPNGQIVVQGAGLHVYDGNLHLTGNLTDRYHFAATGMTFDATGSNLYILDSFTSAIYKLNTTNYDVVAGYSVGPVAADAGGFGNVLQMSGDGSHLVVLGNGNVQIIDLTKATSFEGTANNDVLSGSAGADALFGGAGDDRILGGGGSDQLSGGSGADTFVFRNSAYSSVTISDFTIAQGDKLEFRSVMGIHNVNDVLAHVRDTGLSSYIQLDNGSTINLPNVPGQAIEASSIIVRPVATSDFNGDGHSDILWRNVNGSVSTWNVAGNVRGDQVQQSAFNASVVTSWSIAETFDRNGDGRSDILWRNTNGEVAVWDAQAGGFNQASYGHAAVSTDWRIAGAADFNGDGKDDILWQNQNGSLSTWTSTGPGFVEASYTHASVGQSWKVEGVGDFNGDGKADILWRNDNGTLATWLANGQGAALSFADGGYVANGVPTSWHIDGVGDFNGDGRDDIVWRNDNGAVSIWRSNGTGFDQAVYNTNIDPSWHIAQVGDFNDDGKADILWRNDNGAVSTWQSNGAGFDQSIYNSTAATSWNVAGHDYIL